MDPAIDQGNAAVGGGGHFRAMGDEHDGSFLLAGQPGDEFDDGRAGGGVEIAGGFIGEEHGGLMDKGAGEGGALELTAGELVWAVMGAVGQSDGGKKFLGPLPGEGVDTTGQEKGEEDVFLDRQGWEEMKKLEHEANFEAAERGEFGVIQGVEGVTLEVGLASGGGVEGSENMEKGAFATSTGSGDGDNLPRKDFEGNASQRMNLRISGGV